MRLTWQLLDGDGIGDSDATIEGIYVWYRPIHGQDATDQLQPPFQVTTVTNPTQSSYTVHQLVPYTRYMFFLVPFYRTIEGKPSNCKTERTLESGKPTDIPKPLSGVQFGYQSGFIAFHGMGVKLASTTQ